MFVIGHYMPKQLNTGLRAIEKAPGICVVQRRVNGRMRIVGAKLPGKRGTGTTVKIGRP